MTRCNFSPEECADDRCQQTGVCGRDWFTPEQLQKAERARHNYHYEGKAADVFWNARRPVETVHAEEAMAAALRAVEPAIFRDDVLYIRGRIRAVIACLTAWRRAGTGDITDAIDALGELLEHPSSFATESPAPATPLAQPEEGCWYGVERCTLPHCDCVERNAAAAKAA